MCYSTARELRLRYMYTTARATRDAALAAAPARSGCAIIVYTLLTYCILYTANRGCVTVTRTGVTHTYARDPYARVTRTRA